MKAKKEDVIKAPSGYVEITGTRAPVWEPKAKGEYIQGVCVEDKIVKTQRGRKKIESRLITLKDDSDGSLNAVWVSAALEQLIGKEKTVKGRAFMIAFEGRKKLKAGQNPMKQFRLFERKKGK